YLAANNKTALLPDIMPPEQVNFHYVEQPEGAYGTAIPVALAAREFAIDEPVLVLMGDDFIYNADGSSEVRRLVESTPESGSAMLGVRVPQEEISRYGVIAFDEQQHFTGIVEKPAPEDAPSDQINVSKYVCSA